VSLSSDAEKFIDSFSILVLSENFGTTILEAYPPNKNPVIVKREGHLQRQLRKEKKKTSK